MDVTHNISILNPKCHSANNLRHGSLGLPKLKRSAWSHRNPFGSLDIRTMAFIVAKGDKWAAEVYDQSTLEESGVSTYKMRS
jgi:hypothetical protein